MLDPLAAKLLEVRRPLHWHEEETSAAPLAEPLRLLLSLIVERLDASGSGVLTVKGLAKLL